MNIQSVQCSPLQVAPLRINKASRKPAFMRNDSTSSSDSFASTSSAASVSQQSFGPPTPTSALAQARQRHRSRHNSWQISAKLAARAQQTYEALLCGLGDGEIEEAQIRLRIAREEEDSCRRKVDQAALEIMRIKRAHEREQSIEELPEPSSPGLSHSSSSSSAGSSLSSSSTSLSSCGSPTLPPTPTFEAIDMGALQDRYALHNDRKVAPECAPHDFSIHLKEVRRLERRPAKLVHCSCGAACLCSAVSSMFE